MRVLAIVALLVACGDNGVAADHECDQPSDCPGSDTPCATKSCDDHTCGIAYAPAGTALPSQTTGDCETAQCDGAGMVELVADDGDAPVDPNPCTTETCANGAVVEGVVAIGTACGSNLQCDGGGACVACNLPTDCAGSDSICQKRTCFSGVCGVDDTTAGTSCGSGLTCDGSGSSS